jgi:hypothetical protein
VAFAQALMHAAIVTTSGGSNLGRLPAREILKLPEQLSVLAAYPALSKCLDNCMQRKNEYPADTNTIHKISYQFNLPQFVRNTVRLLELP